MRLPCVLLACLLLAPMAAQSQGGGRPQSIIGTPMSAFGERFNETARRINVAVRAVEIECGERVQITCQYTAGPSRIITQGQLPARQVTQILLGLTGRQEDTPRGLMALETLIAMAEPTADQQERIEVIRSLITSADPSQVRRTANLRQTSFEMNVAPGMGVFITVLARPR